MQLPTKRVFRRQTGDVAIINASEFDERLHVPVVGQLRMLDGKVLFTVSGKSGWDAVSEIPGGGQGRLFLAKRATWDANTELSQYVEVLRHVILRDWPAPGATTQAEATAVSEERWVAATSRLLEQATKYHAQPCEHVLKVFKPRDEVAWERSDQEYDMLRRSKDPGIVEVVDHGTLADSHGTRWTVYRYYSRGAISKHVAMYEGNALACLKAVEQLLAILVRLHEEKIWHRDIKPDNIFVADSGALVLGDFGLARQDSDHPSLTRTGDRNIGAWQFRPLWRAVEASVDYDYAVDLYSLGKTLWCLAAGNNEPPEREEFAADVYDLRRRWPSNRGIELVYRILPKILVDRRGKVKYESTTAMRADVAAQISELERGLLPPGQRPDRCASCQKGTYARHDISVGLATWLNTVVNERVLKSRAVPEGMEFWRCNACGHIRMYARPPRGG